MGATVGPRHQASGARGTWNVNAANRRHARPDLADVGRDHRGHNRESEPAAAAVAAAAGVRWVERFEDAGRRVDGNAGPWSPTASRARHSSRTRDLSTGVPAGGLHESVAEQAPNRVQQPHLVPGDDGRPIGRTRSGGRVRPPTRPVSRAAGDVIEVTPAASSPACSAWTRLQENCRRLSSGRSRA